jgi:RNA polymerase sigma-70 factor (ECF subfamily)
MTAKRSFDEIEREFGPMIRRLALSYEADKSLAEELVQDIWLALWRAMPDFRGESSLKTFLARIATYRAIAHVRNQTRRPRTMELSADVPASEPNPEHQAIQQDRQAKLLGAVRSLPLSPRQVTLLTLEGLKPQEIADVLGISANAVAIRLSRAKELLRITLGEMP